MKIKTEQKDLEAIYKLIFNDFKMTLNEYI